MDWKVVHDQYHLKTSKELVLDIALYFGDNIDVHTAIPQRDSGDGPHNLGARLAPSGNNAEEMLHLIQKGRTLGQNISASQLQRHEVMIAYKTSMLRPSMKCPLCGTKFTAKESAKNDRSFLPTLLTTMGFNAKTKRLLFFGPPSLGCFGFTDTYMDQGISQVQMLLSHMRHQDEIGILLQILLEKLQLIIGLPLLPLTYDPQRFLRYLEPSWLKNVWEFIYSIKGHVHLEDCWELGEQRAQDKKPHVHVDIVIAPRELKRLNACMPFLQMVTVADISDATGRFMTNNIFKGNRHPDTMKSY